MNRFIRSDTRSLLELNSIGCQLVRLFFFERIFCLEISMTKTAVSLCDSSTETIRKCFIARFRSK